MIEADVRLATAMTLLFLLIPTTQIAVAAEPTILEAEGEVTLAAFSQVSPTPVRWTTWNHDLAGGPVYDSELDIPDTDMLWGYAMHCGPDGLICRAAWAEYVPEPAYFFLLIIESHATCLVQVEERIGLVVERTLDRPPLDNLDVSFQEVVLTRPDGTSVELVGTASGEFGAELVLEPGVYRISINARYEDHLDQDRLAAEVSVAWNDATVPTASATWSGVKALYR